MARSTGYRGQVLPAAAVCHQRCDPVEDRSEAAVSDGGAGPKVSELATVPATRAPASTSGAVRLRVRFPTITSCPSASSRCAIAVPIAPVPTTEMRGDEVWVMTSPSKLNLT